jgi:hypothetical protein
MTRAECLVAIWAEVFDRRVVVWQVGWSAGARISWVRMTDEATTRRLVQTLAGQPGVVGVVLRRVEAGPLRSGEHWR